MIYFRASHIRNDAKLIYNVDPGWGLNYGQIGKVGADLLTKGKHKKITNKGCFQLIRFQKDGSDREKNVDNWNCKSICNWLASSLYFLIPLTSMEPMYRKWDNQCLKLLHSFKANVERQIYPATVSNNWLAANQEDMDLTAKSCYFISGWWLRLESTAWLETD